MWKRHRITIDSQVEISNKKLVERIIARAIRVSLKGEGVRVPCEVNVLLTDDGGIQEINQEQRQIDAPTDVLSFPMLELEAGQALTEKTWADEHSGRTVLGDMVISLERVKAQAAEYGHSRTRELSYLVVHSTLHLLGYDHLDEGMEKALMRGREEAILYRLDIKR